jgi:hypothetical protein
VTSGKLHEETIAFEVRPLDLTANEAVGKHECAAVRADGDEQLLIGATELHVGTSRVREMERQHEMLAFRLDA